jgi:hypothetical protein
VNKLVAMVTIEHKQFKATVLQGSHKKKLNLNNLKVIEAMGLKIIASMSP